jgi:undecaprenyl diphosphate synthase
MPHDPVAHARSVGLDPGRLPRHVAIVMDGNGRWATRQGKPRAFGHARGADSVRTVVEECCRLGLTQLTLYCLSSENWKRPKEEIEFLMVLLKEYLLGERATIDRENIRFTVIGRRTGIPDDVQAEMDESIRRSASHTGLTLCLAINYGSRTEIADACRAVAEKVRRGELSPEQVDEETVAAHLYTAGMPDPDLLIRTAGELRVSNYLLWQISYAELWVTDTCWPDFTAQTLHAACRDFAGRNRRFGGLTPC